MAYDLRGAGGEYSFNKAGFSAVLRLAERCGWQPAGTTLYLWREGHPNTVDPFWGRSYFSNDGQQVSGEDAMGIAAALEQALDDIPDIEVPGASAADLYGQLSGTDWKDYLRGFIDFCRAGSFIIN